MEKEKKHRTSSDEMLNASYEYNEVSYKYDAFISYRHVEPDQTVAKYVHQMIETFKAPKDLFLGCFVTGKNLQQETLAHR